MKESKLPTVASYGTGKFLVEFYSAAFSVLLFKYYETNIQLSSALTGAAIIIYSIWNAFNDPIVGYFTIKPTRFAKKYGRRFPWIVFGCFIWIFTLIPIFLIPSNITQNPEANQIPIFLWLVFAVVIHDTFFSIWELNYQSLFPDKFRGEKIRTFAAGLATVIGVIGIALGNLLPTFIIDDYSDTGAYLTTIYIFTIIGIVFFFLFMPGCRENKDMIDRYMLSVEKEKDQEEESFFKQLGETFKHRNFLAFVLFYFLYQSCTLSMSASVDYIGDYILPGGKNDTTIIFAGMLVGALISIPLWGKIALKVKSNQKALMLAAWVIIASLIPTAISQTQLHYTISITIFGIGFGGYWFLITPCMADVIDEIVVKTKRRNDGVYMGIRAFFGRFAYAIQALSFAVVHSLTNFINEADVQQPPEALLGIRIHMAVLPMIFMLLGLFIFWKFNTLNPKKMEEIHKELEQLDL